MSDITLPNPAASRPFRWDVFRWFVAVHALGFVGLGYLVPQWYYGFDPTRILASIFPPTFAVAVGMFFACHIAITAGMHRLHCHRSYKATKPLEYTLLVLSAGVFQDSNLWWATTHFLHHAHSDTPQDPYSVKHGFWWAHMGWMLRSSRSVPKITSSHLLENPLLRWQHRNYWWLSFGVGLGLPTAATWLWNGDWLGGLLIGGFMRIMIQWHMTWCINSVAHTFGKRRYGNVGTAGSNLLLGLPTVGEGSAHDRHHLAEEDYRIDPRWYALDVGKWFIYLCYLLGLAYDLKRVSEETVERRARFLAQQMSEAGKA